MQIPTNWTFKTSEVASGFDRHVREQLPWYELTTGMTAHIARHYIPEGGRIYDIGASTGNIGRAIHETIKARSAEFVAIDNSEAMRQKYDGPGELVIADAARFEFKPFDVAVLFLSLMFLTITDRLLLIESLRRNIRSGGAIIVIDKSQPVGGYISTVMWRLALAGKLATGCKSDEIIAKELSLAGVQRPIDPTILGDCIEVFRFGEFAGWVIEG